MNKIQYVLFVGDGDMRKQINMSSMQKVYDFVFNLDINLFFKRHPDGEILNIDNNIRQLYEFVPCELYLSYFDCVVGGFSAVIQISTMLDIKTISYMNLIEYNYDWLKDIWKERLDKYGNGKLLYPDSFEELRDMLIKC